jgi:rhodanese-related sulfurtransferase
MKILTSLVCFVALAGFAVGAEKVSVEQAEKLIEGDIQLVDVRTQEEWDAGHLEGATRIEITADGFSEKAEAALDGDKPVLVYCRSGSRSARAAEALEKLGFEMVKDLDGGITAWREAGKKVVKPEKD